MSPKQQRYCDEYLICLNATQAALRSGYSKSTAMKKAPLWIGKYRGTSLYPEMFDYLKFKREALENEYHVSQGEILKRLDMISKCDPAKLVDDFGDRIPIQEIDESTRAAIIGIEFNTDGTIKKLKFSCKNTANSIMIKMLGYNPAEKIQHEVGFSFLDFLKKATAAKQGSSSNSTAVLNSKEEIN